MAKLEIPQSFVTRQECDKVAFQNGFRRAHDEADGWRRYSSTTAQGTIWLARDDRDTWWLAIDHAGVMAEIEFSPYDVNGPGLVQYQFSALASLYAGLSRIYELAVSLPDAPLQEFIHRTKDLPKTTEAERLVIQRVGQGIFRERLMNYWQRRCPITGISDPELLRASHIKPWRVCHSDSERLDVHNGLLLSALWDAAFDKGLVTFGDNGMPIYSSSLSDVAKAALKGSMSVSGLSLTQLHQAKMSWHRRNIFTP